MFNLSKLINLVLGVVTLGSIGGIIAPITLGIDHDVFKKDISKSSFDLSTLISAEEALDKELTNSKNKYSSALSWLNHVKKIKFHKILETFSKLFKKEGDIETQYKDAQKKFQELLKVLQQKGAETIKKLEYDKAKESLSLVEKGLSGLSQGLKVWKEGFQTIICALDSQDQGGSCSSSSSRTRRSVPAGGGGTEEKGSEKAKKSLNEVKEALEKTNKEIETSLNNAQEFQKKVKNMKIYQQALSSSSSLLLSAFSAQESSLQLQIQGISEKIKNLFEDVKQLTQEIQEINKAMELLKKNISTVKSYEGKFVNAICNLYTVENKDCKLNKDS